MVYIPNKRYRIVIPAADRVFPYPNFEHESPTKLSHSHQPSPSNSQPSVTIPYSNTHTRASRNAKAPSYISDYHCYLAQHCPAPSNLLSSNAKYHILTFLIKLQETLSSFS